MVRPKVTSVFSPLVRVNLLYAAEVVKLIHLYNFMAALPVSRKI